MGVGDKPAGGNGTLKVHNLGGFALEVEEASERVDQRIIQQRKEEMKAQMQ